MKHHTINTTAHGADLRFMAHGSQITNGARGIVVHIGHACSTMCLWISTDDARAIAHAMTCAADEALMHEEVTE